MRSPAQPALVCNLISSKPRPLLRRRIRSHLQVIGHDTDGGLKVFFGLLDLVHGAQRASCMTQGKHLSAASSQKVFHHVPCCLVHARGLDFDPTPFKRSMPQLCCVALRYQAHAHLDHTAHQHTLGTVIVRIAEHPGQRADPQGHNGRCPAASEPCNVPGHSPGQSYTGEK